MFVLSMKTTRTRMFTVFALVAMLLVTVFSLSGRPTSTATAAPVAADDAARQQYLADLGYEVLPNKSEVREILIPTESDEAFAEYNRLQLEAGHDLTEYSGKRVKCWTYTVTNYPTEDTVQAHLYIYKDKIIGGDIASTAQDGFCHGLKPMRAA
ncbi:MAG: DUF4830 domain-containing protein [Clostridia bacterium]|nr:DUF4830 domain-containing protein [Clostridia bacterium]